MELLDITGFLGHLHPLVVHLPIGFLLLAMIFDLLSYRNRFAYLKTAVSFTLLAGFITAIAACIFGYMLSLSGGYEDATLNNHRFSGILLTVIAGLLFLATTQKARAILPVPPRLFSSLFLVVALLMAYTGHQGGNLTHGDSYLSIETLTQQHRQKPASAEAAMIFEDIVQPVLESRCGQCHQAGKLKGKLSVKTLAGLLKGGKHGAAIVPGKPAESELFKRITLDPDNEEYMPADGKPPLTKNEVEIIRWWIQKAMATEGKTVASFKDKDAIAPRISFFLGLTKTLPAEINSPIAQQINPDIPQTADTAVIRKLRNDGLMVRVMLKKPVMLDITLPAGSGKKMADIKDDLKSIAKNIIWLNLSANGFTDKDLDFLNLLTNIEKLRLQGNPVTDNISEQLIALPHLEAVNLNETNITNQALGRLAKNPALKRIYTWKTAVSDPALIPVLKK